MGITQLPVEPHWNYLLAIERDLDVLSRYIDFDKRNFACFSIEIARILLAAGAEADVVCKQICKTANAKSKADNINDYRDEVKAAFPALPAFGVQVPPFGLVLKPWDEWRKAKGVPFWWTAYNKTKHHRQSQFHLANLENALNAVAGLFVAAVHLYPERARLGQLLPSPQLLRPAEDRCSGTTHDGFEIGFNYVV